MSDANKALVRRAHELMVEDVDKLDEYFSADFVSHNKWGDLAGLKKVIADWRNAGPLAITVDDLIADGDKVAVRVSIETAAAGEDRVIHAVAIYRLADGKIVEGWSHSDAFY